jgi:16S rRNA (cytosine967-C5)-methyltransferase
MVSGEGGARLVNAVLRAAAAGARERCPTGDTPEAVGVRLSHPDWLAAIALDLLGPDDATALLAAHNRPAPADHPRARRPRRSAGPHRGRGRAAHAGQVRAVGLPPGAPARRSPRRVSTRACGRCRTRPRSSSRICSTPQPGEALWDACAAPGGKSRHLYDLQRARGPGGTLLSTDAHAGKVTRLGETLAGLAGVTTARHDATQPPPGVFDRVLLDAPCSGLGTLRRHPEIRWRRTPEVVAALAAEQTRMLEQAARAVKPGGVLVYSVCTITEAEGPGAVADFLGFHPEFRIEAPSAGPVDWAALAVPMGYRTWPHRHDMDGFFAVRLRRKA